MMRILSSSTHRLFRHPQLRAFSSAPKNNPHDAEDKVTITKQNPQEWPQTGRKGKIILSLHLQPTQQYGTAPVQITLNSNVVARSIGELAVFHQTELASDYLNLPKITEGGISVYDSIGLASTNFIMINKMLTIVSPFLILVVTPTFALTTLTYFTFCGIYYTLYWKLAKDLVLRVELSPQTEELIYQKLSIFGGINTFRVKISELEHTNFSEIFGEKDPSERAVRGIFNREVAFRIRSTNEYLFFDKNGVWNEEGLNHDLLL